MVQNLLQPDPRVSHHYAQIISLAKSAVNDSRSPRMDPLSITVSALAIVSAISSSLKILSTVLGAYDEATALFNEVNDLQAVLHDVQSILKESKSARTESLQTALAESKRTVLLLHDFIHTRLLKEEDFDNIRLSRLAWLREKVHISRFHRDLKTNRAELNTALNVANLVIGSRMELSVANIVAVSNDTRTFLAEQGLHHEKMASEIRDLRHLLMVSSRRVQWSRAASSASDGTRTPTTVPALDKESLPVDEKKGLEVQLLWQSPTTCSKECCCVCHRDRLARSPSTLEAFLGVLFIGYTSLPFLRPQCNVAGCLREKGQALRFTWYFPAWFVKRSIAFTYALKPCNGLQVSLKVTRLVDTGAAIFAMTQRGDLNGVQALFEQQLASPLDVGHLDGCTALHFAVLRGHLHIVDFLLKSGADPNALDTVLESPKQTAWNLILQKRVSPKTATYYRESFPISDMQEEYGFSKVHEIVLGLKHGKLETALKDSPETVNSLDMYHRTPLMWASIRKNKSVVKKLLQHGANVQSHDKMCSTPLHYAALGGDVECVRSLTKAGAKIQPGMRSKDPIHQACDTHDNVELIRALLERHPDTNARDGYNRAYLAFASWRNHHAVVKFLCEYGADMETVDAFGASPLLRAVRYGAVDAADELVNAGANLMAKDRSECTILHRAALSRSQPMLEFLADKIATKLVDLDIEAKDMGDMTARERLHELQPTPGIIASFVRLTAAIEHAKNQLNLDRLSIADTLLGLNEYVSDSDSDDAEFFDVPESNML